MLRFAVSLCLFPMVAVADDIAVSSRVAEATLFYPQTGEIVRHADYLVPAGAHRLIVTDVPIDDGILGGLRVKAPGLRIGAITMRQEDRPSLGVEENPDVTAAKDLVEQRAADLRQGEDRVAEIRLRVEAAKFQIDYLRRIAPGEEPLAADAVGAVVRQIGGDALAALQAVHTAGIEARDAELALKDLREALVEAQRALAALVEEDRDRLYLLIAVSAEAETTGQLELRYTTQDVGWWPIYDLELTQGETDILTLRRKASVFQRTGENWQDVALTLSTTPFGDATEATELYPWIRRVFIPAPSASVRLRSESSADLGKLRPQALEAPIIVEEAGAFGVYDGPNVTYVYPTPLSLASGADEVRISLGEVTTEAEVFARATSLEDDTAFLTASFVNDMGDPILGTDEMSIFVDGALIGQESIDETIASGTEAEFGFGPLQSVLVSRIVEDRNEGDRGVISRSNVESERARLRVENRSAETVSLRLRDRVPVSDQEDLEITWDANPRPTLEDVDDKRGVLEWQFELAPGAERDIRLSHQLRWPEGQILQ